ncbi:MAG: serine/threonine protein kinase, partial [Comamonadaceae bacterium]
LAYIAMEFLKGRDLVDYCKDGNLLPVPRVLSIVARVAEALAYAHRQNVVHRDIKPANIMYELDSDTVKVTDFGIARITDSSKTKTGLVLGTPSFMSPEQIAGKKVDGRSDLYSLAVMLYQMLTGVLPFRGDSMAELMYKIANEEAPDVRIIRKDLPERLAHVVALALAKKPELRYQDGDQFAADLKAPAGQAAGSVPAGGPAPRAVDSAPSAAAADQKTQAFSLDAAAQARAEAEKTVVLAAGAAPAAPGYDAALSPAAGASGYEKTAVFNPPDPAGGKADPKA